MGNRYADRLGRWALRLLPRPARGSGADRVADPCGRHDRPAVRQAAVKEQLPEPGDVSKRRADTAVGHGIAAGVHGDLRIELRTHRLPQLPGYEQMQPGPGCPFE